MGRRGIIGTRGLPLIAVAACFVCSPLRGIDVHCQGGSDGQTCTGVGGKLESCLSGKCLFGLDEHEVATWLHCARGHEPSLSISGRHLSKLSVHEIGDVLGVPLQDASVVHDLMTQQFCGPPASGIAVETEIGPNHPDALDTFYQGREGEGPALLARLAIFERRVCAKCERRGVDCMCEDEDESPLMLLREYAALHAQYNDIVREIGRFASDVKYVVVQVAEHEGVGNQMLKMITGLIFALNMKRALVVQPLSPGAGSSIDPVINFFTEYPAMESMRVQLDNAGTLDSFMCDDVREVWGLHPVLILENAMQAPHIFLNNPHFGAGLRARLLGLPVFFLSHFFWSGAQHSWARVASLPLPMPWDGRRPFAALARDLSARGARVVGVHMRTGAAQVSVNSSSAVRFIQLDHAGALREWNASGEDRSGDFCSGHPASMEPMYECLLELRAELRAQDPQTLLVVLWAADQGPMTAGLQQRIAALDKVCLVRILHDAEAGHGADDVVRKRDSGLFDMELLSLSEFVLGGTGSTFSFLSHTRALALPKYSAFVKPGGPKCASAGGPEAGLITVGAAYDQCSSVGGMDVRCEGIAPRCVGVLIQLWKYERCLQERAVCWQRDLAWLEPFVVGVEYVRYFQSFLMRMRGVLRVPPNVTQPMHYPSCYPEPHWT